MFSFRTSHFLVATVIVFALYSVHHVQLFFLFSVYLIFGSTQHELHTRDDELHQIRDILHSSTNSATAKSLADRLAETDRQIEALRAVRESIVADTRSYESGHHLKEYNALLSPMRRVPTEILNEIFMHTIPEDHPAVMSRYHPPLSLTQVCSRWRSVAHASTSLWSSVFVSVPDQPTPTALCSSVSTAPIVTLLEARIRGLRDWLDRSKAKPLSIGVYDKSQLATSYPLTMVRQKLLDALIAYSHRWREVTLCCVTSDLKRLTALGPADLPILESLTIRTSPIASHAHVGDGPAGLSIWGGSNVLTAPRLRAFRINSVSESLRKVAISWDKLTDLELGHGLSSSRSPFLSLSRLAWVLRVCGKLVRGSFEVSRACFEFPDHVVCVPHLEELRLAELDEHVDAKQLFSILDLPKLVKVDYIPAGWSNDSFNLPESPLLTLLRRCGFGLKILQTSTVWRSVAEVKESLDLSPELEQLVLDRPTDVAESPGVVVVTRDQMRSLARLFNDGEMLEVLRGAVGVERRRQCDIDLVVGVRPAEGLVEDVLMAEVEDGNGTTATDEDVASWLVLEEMESNECEEDRGDSEEVLALLSSSTSSASASTPRPRLLTSPASASLATPPPGPHGKRPLSRTIDIAIATPSSSSSSSGPSSSMHESPPPYVPTEFSTPSASITTTSLTIDHPSPSSDNVTSRLQRPLPLGDISIPTPITDPNVERSETSTTTTQHSTPLDEPQLRSSTRLAKITINFATNFSEAELRRLVECSNDSGRSSLKRMKVVLAKREGKTAIREREGGQPGGCELIIEYADEIYGAQRWKSEMVSNHGHDGRSEGRYVHVHGSRYGAAHGLRELFPPNPEGLHSVLELMTDGSV